MCAQLRLVERVADILGCFTPDTPELGVSEISSRLQLDKATVCRILLTLKSKGLVLADPSTHRYTIGPKILQLAEVSIGRAPLHHRALPHMQWLRDQVGETVTLEVRVDFQSIFIEQVESRHEVKQTIQIGTPRPLHSGSRKLLLAYMTDEEIEQYLATIELTAFTESTITDRGTLQARLREVREQGFVVSKAERIPGSAGMSVPIYDHRNQVVAALGLAMPEMRFDPQKVPQQLLLLRTAAGRLSRDLGATCVLLA